MTTKELLAKLEMLRLSLLPHQKKAAYLIIAFLTLFLLFQCAPRADAAEVRFDPGARVLRGETATIRYSFAFNEVAPGIRPVVGLGLLGSSNDPDYGPEDNNGYFYGGIEAARGRFSLTLGGASLIRESVYSGTRAQFVLEARARLYQWRRWGMDAVWFHMSNSGIGKPNPGFDLVGPSFHARW